MAVFVFDVRDAKKAAPPPHPTGANGLNWVFPASVVSVPPIPNSVLWNMFLPAVENVAVCYGLDERRL